MASYSTHPGGPSGALPARSAHDEPNRKGTSDPGTVLGLIATGALAATAIGVATARARQHDRDRRPPDDAPARTAVRNRMGDYALVGKTVTINKPKAELYAFFRDFQNLPTFMENVHAITPPAEGDADAPKEPAPLPLHFGRGLFTLGRTADDVQFLLLIRPLSAM